MTVNKVAALGLGLAPAVLAPWAAALSSFWGSAGFCRIALMGHLEMPPRGKGKGLCFPISITLWGQDEPQVSHPTGAAFQCQPPPWPRGRHTGPCVCVV